jgi:hypothetical protein
MRKSPFRPSVRRGALFLVIGLLSLSGSWSEARADVPLGLILKFLSQYDSTLAKYEKLYHDLKDGLEKGQTPLVRGLDIIAGKPIVFDEKALQQIEDQTVTFSNLAKTLEAPPFDPMQSVDKEKLESADWSAREAELNKIEEACQSYEQSVQRMEEKRIQAVRIFNEADSAYERLRNVSDRLGKINSSAAGVLLNVATENRFSWLWLDTTTTVFDAVGHRYAAAHDLLNSYDRILAKMRVSLKAYQQVRAWAAFYKLQGRLRQRLALAKDGDVQKLLSDADKQLGQGKANLQSGNETKAPSRETQGIDAINTAASQEIEATRAEIKRLWEQAAQADSEAARHQETMALIALASSAAGIANSAGGASSAPSGGGPTEMSGKFEFQSPTEHYLYEVKITRPASPPTSNVEVPTAK